MAIKLIKACKELNIGVSTAVEFLTKNGFEDVQTDPTYRISDDAYLILAKEFDPIMGKRLTSSAEGTRTKEIKLSAEDEAKVNVIIRQYLQGKDYIELAAIGLALNKYGIKYNGKLKPFLSHFSDSFEIFTDNSINPPVDYIRCWGETINSESVVAEESNVKTAETKSLEVVVQNTPIIDGKKVKEIINQCLRDKNQVNLVSIGKELSKQGISYTGKLRAFLSQYSDTYDIYTDNKSYPPIYYIRFLEGRNRVHVEDLSKKPQVEKAKVVTFSLVDQKIPTQPTAKKKGTAEKMSVPDLFRDFAWFSNLDSDLRHFAEGSIIKEPWVFHGSINTGLKNEEKSSYTILLNYLRYTFVRLWNENKICEATDERGCKYSAFNTGLADYGYRYFYAIFKENQKGGQQNWKFLGFSTAEKGIGKTILSNYFSDLPQRANYCENPSDYIFRLPKNQLKIEINVDHIIDRIERLPLWYIKECCEIGDYQYKEIHVSSLEAKNDTNPYYKKLKEHFRNDQRVWRKILKDFETAMSDAIIKVEWNYKRAVPIYYARENKVCLILPISLREDDGIHIAVVIQKRPHRYTQETIYPIEWAYAYARLIAKPDSEWLTATDLQEKEVFSEVPDLETKSNSIPQLSQPSKVYLQVENRYIGTIVSDFNIKKIAVNGVPFLVSIKDKNWLRFADGDKVSFTYKKEQNRYREDSSFYFATDLEIEKE